MSSKNVTESVLERKRLEKEIKAKEKAEKAKEKADRAVLLAKIRQSKPDQCMKVFMKITYIKYINLFIVLHLI